MQQDVPAADSLKPELLAWLQKKERPQVIWDMARSHPPDGEYALSSGADEDLYLVYSYSEDGTITVVRYGRLVGAPNSVLPMWLPMWKVFGMKPEDLVRTDAVD